MSGLFFGGFAAPAVAGFRIQSSVLGLPIPVVYGRARVSGNLIHLLDQSQQPVGGKAASKSGSAQYTYRAAVVLAIAEGPIAGIIRGWTDKDGVKLFNAYASDGWSLAYGSSSQAAWTYLSSLHSTEAVPYQFVAYVANTAFDMPSGVLPNLSWEVDGFLAVGGGILDANPKDILVDVVTDVNHGLALPASLFGNLTPYHDFCLAADLLVSPAFTALRPARDSLAELFQASCSVPIWSDGTLKVVPYCDAPMTGNGVTYTPNTTPLYDLTDDQFLRTGDAPPVSVQRTAAADAHNQFFVAYEDRLTGLGPTFLTSYSPGVAEAKDQASLELGFFRPASTIQLPMIKRASVAQYVAQMAMQRELNVRNTYRFQLGWKFSLLEPMDLVTLTDAGLGLSRTPVRIVEVHDLDGDAGIDIIAEDWPFGTATAARYTTQVGSGTAASQGVDPGNTATPAITAGPRALGTDPFQIWIAAGGGALWGGCEVWLSTDGTQYYQVGTLTSRGTYGTLTAALPAGPALPATDATNTLAVDVTVSGGALQSGVAADVAALLTLCAVGDEYVTFTTATLTSALHYALTGLGRGAYSTNHGYHAAGSAFLRCNDAVLKVPFDQGVDGQVLYFKFPAFNVFGRGRQSLASVSAVTYTIVRPDRTLPQLAPFARIDGATTVAFTWTRNARTNAVWVYDSLIAVGAADPYDSGAASPTVLAAGTDAYTAQIPPQGKERRLHFAPVDLNGTASNVIDFEVYPPNTMAPVGQPRAVFNTNRDAADVYVALTSPASETITASFRDSEAAGAPVYALCVSGSDATPLYVASGTEIGPANWFTYAGTQTQRLAAIALKRDQIKRLYFTTTGSPSGAQGASQVALSMKEQAWLESLSATWDNLTGLLTLTAKGGANCASCLFEISASSTFATIAYSYSAALGDGGALPRAFALTGTERGKVWYARATPYNAAALAGLAGVAQQDECYVPTALGGYTLTPTESGSTGTLTVVVTDAGLALDTALRVSWAITTLGGRTLYAVNGSGTGITTTGPTTGPTTGTYAISFPLVQDHNTKVEALIHMVDGSTIQLGGETFDSDRIANVLNVDVTPLGLVTATFDSDTASGASAAQYSLNGGSTWTNMTVTNRVATVTITPTAAAQTILIRGVNGTASPGPSVTAIIPAGLAGLAILAVQATPAGGPYTGISIPITFSGMPTNISLDVGYDNGGGNIDHTSVTTTVASGTVVCTAGAATFSVSQTGKVANGDDIFVNAVRYTVSALGGGGTTCTLSGSPTFSAVAFNLTKVTVTFTPGVVFNAVGGAPGNGAITAIAQGPAGTVKTAVRYKTYLT